MKKIKWGIRLELLLLAAVGCVCLMKELHMYRQAKSLPTQEESGESARDMKDMEDIEGGEAIEVSTDGNFIKWVDFNITNDALSKAYELDTASYGKDIHVDWIELLAYVGARHGGKFDKKSVSELQDTAEKLQSGETTIEELSKDMEYYDYYEEAYEAVLGGMVGEFSIEVQAEGTEEKEWKDYYGLKAFSPIAKGFEYSHYDDFGSSRSYGYARPHLGHDMMGQIGTPIIAIESGYVEALGWNQYGGWRIGIRSFDGKRYYYYAHLRQNFPYNKSLEEGSIVTAGDVIGYMGHTGYSATENVNNIEVVHLHWGMQLIFDESQKDSDNEIWIDCYELTKFLYKNRSQTQKDEATKEWNRVYNMRDPAVENHCKNEVPMIQ
ncbi:MAG: M23 family metallopeptidase [Blautia sp.]|nr:M23 family metallopeptidase [Lachnoclostridium sp.]MCM1210113.1 M23 family metallopeptidase [Blautia sp.]